MSPARRTTVVSQRFKGAARRERDRLGRRLKQKQEKAGALAAEMAALEQQINELGGLVGEPPPPGDPTVLSGRRIRDVAVPLLTRDRAPGSPIHYRDWLRLVEAEGWTIAGKRPDAVFLNNVTRHPQVQATTTRGFYVLVEHP